MVNLTPHRVVEVLLQVVSSMTLAFKQIHLLLEVAFVQIEFVLHLLIIYQLKIYQLQVQDCLRVLYGEMEQY
jgi:hypothetical protein